MTNIEIASCAKLQNIETIAQKIGLCADDLELFGKFKAKICAGTGNKNGKLVLVTAINPTPAGEGKTTVSIGLADALSQMNESVCLALREPSLGPVFGIKGGATGSGQSQIAPMADINLHFNGDFHAITSANNLLCAYVDNHIFHGNTLNINPKNIAISRCLDVNDRALRTVGLDFDKQTNSFLRTSKFNITAASEIMAILCMASDFEDLKHRIGNIIVAHNFQNQPVFAKDLQAQDSVAILLLDAIKPNLVQTLAGTPAIVHGGPFANIAHGCNSIIATKMALSRADFCITEAGFGADLGAQKFLDTKCQVANLTPSAVVLVATIRALKYHGGLDANSLTTPSIQHLNAGFSNLARHIKNLKEVYNLPVVVAVNRFTTDTQAEIDFVCHEVEALGVDVAECDVWSKGGAGATKLAQIVKQLCSKPPQKLRFSYNIQDSIKNKITQIATKIYGAKSVEFGAKALQNISRIEQLPSPPQHVIIAKTQYSFSHDAKLLGAPSDFVFKIRDVEVRSGAGFVVALAGTMVLMPGLPTIPAGMKMHVSSDGTITGLS